MIDYFAVPEALFLRLDETKSTSRRGKNSGEIAKAGP